MLQRSRLWNRSTLLLVCTTFLQDAFSPTETVSKINSRGSFEERTVSSFWFKRISKSARYLLGMLRFLRDNNAWFIFIYYYHNFHIFQKSECIYFFNPNWYKKRKINFFLLEIARDRSTTDKTKYKTETHKTLICIYREHKGSRCLFGH